MVLNVEDYIGSSVLYIKGILKAGITDPILSSRSSSAKFILTAYPERETQYPHITIKFDGQGNAQDSGQRDESMFVEVRFELRVWGRNSKEKDTLMSQAVNVLRRNQITVTEGSISFGLVDFKVPSIVPIDESGSDGIKSNVATITYNLELYN